MAAINEHDISNDSFRLAQINGIIRFNKEIYKPEIGEKPEVKYKKFYDDILDIINTIQPGEEDV